MYNIIVKIFKNFITSKRLRFSFEKKGKIRKGLNYTKKSIVWKNTLSTYFTYSTFSISVTKASNS